VYKNGTLSAKDAVIEGKITATSGEIQKDCKVNGDISGATGTFTKGLNIGNGNFKVDGATGNLTV
jgi:hypothetical protein